MPFNAACQARKLEGAIFILFGLTWSRIESEFTILVRKLCLLGRLIRVVWVGEIGRSGDTSFRIQPTTRLTSRAWHRRFSTGDAPARAAFQAPLISRHSRRLPVSTFHRNPSRRRAGSGTPRASAKQQLKEVKMIQINNVKSCILYQSYRQREMHAAQVVFVTIHQQSVKIGDTIKKLWRSSSQTTKDSLQLKKLLHNIVINDLRNLQVDSSLREPRS